MLEIAQIEEKRGKTERDSKREKEILCFQLSYKWESDTL